MTAQAWHYQLPNGERGTVVGEHLETPHEARKAIAWNHGVRPVQVRVRKAGEDYERDTHLQD